ncbi:MAG: hypothetical protein ACOZBW_02555 [Thermodesulfobacteriota bacterium]
MIYSNNRTLHNFWIINVASVALGMLFHDNLAADMAPVLAGPTAIQSTSLKVESKSTPADHRIGISGILRDNGGIVFQFLNTLSLDLADRNAWLCAEAAPASPTADESADAKAIDQYVLINGEKKHISAVKRGQVVSAACRAAAETLGATGLGQKVRAIERELARYFVVEVSKDRFADHADLFLPGEGILPDKKTEKEYTVCLGTSLYTATDSLKGRYALELNALYHGCHVNITHDFGHGETALLVENDPLNRLLNLSASFYLEKKTDGPASAMISFSWQL